MPIVDRSSPRKNSARRFGGESVALGTPVAMQDSDATVHNPLSSENTREFQKLL